MTSPALAKAAHSPARGAGYASARDAVLTPRQAEYRLFAGITHRLSEAAGALRDGDRRAHGRLIAALNDNLRLWLTLAVDLAGDGNGLPEALRAQLISLAGFVERSSARALGAEGDPAAAAEALVEINASIMKGLRGRPEAG